MTALLPILASDWPPPTLRGVLIALGCVILCALLLKLRTFRS